MLKTTRHCGNALILVPSGSCPLDMRVSELFAEGPVSLRIVPCPDGSLEVEVTAPHTLMVLDQPTPGTSSRDPAVQGDLFDRDEADFDEFLEQEAARLAMESETVSKIKTNRKQSNAK